MEGQVQGGQTGEQEPEVPLGEDDGKPGSLEGRSPELAEESPGGNDACRGETTKNRAEHAAPAAADVGTRDLASLRPDDLEVRIARHQFPLGVVAGSLALVLRTGTRLQRVAAVLAMHWNWCGLDVASRPVTIRCGCGCCGWACTN